MTIMSYYFKIKTDKRKGENSNMKNDSKLVKFTAFVLLLTMVVLCLVSGTFAKYTSQFGGEDTAIVAKWDVTAGEANEKFEIFKVSEIYDTEGVTDFTAGGTNDDNVKDGEAGADTEAVAIIAPGTWGTFSYSLTNDSEVNAKYSITYTANEMNVPLLWSKDGQTWEDDITALNVVDAEMNMGTLNTPVAVYWKWDFEADAARDVSDTTLGIDASASPIAEVSVVFTQVD